jgi:hypothetical protein
MKRLLLVSTMITISFNTYTMKRHYPYNEKGNSFTQAYHKSLEESTTPQQKKAHGTLITVENVAKIAKLSNNTITVIPRTTDYYASIMLQLKSCLLNKPVMTSQPIPSIIITSAPHLPQNTKKQPVQKNKLTRTTNKNHLQVNKRKLKANKRK